MHTLRAFLSNGVRIQKKPGWVVFMTLSVLYKQCGFVSKLKSTEELLNIN